jgi:hypothetical protein
MGIHLYSWVFIGIHWYSFVFIGIHWYSLAFIGIHWYSLVFISIHLYSWVFICIHGYSLVFIGIHWYSLVFTGNLTEISQKSHRIRYQNGEFKKSPWFPLVQEAKSGTQWNRHSDFNHWCSNVLNYLGFSISRNLHWKTSKMRNSKKIHGFL